MIKRVVKADKGVYTCKATNKYGTAQSQGRMIVLSEYIVFFIVDNI